MRLRNAPYRAIRKLRMDGVKSLYEEVYDLALTEIFFYRVFYWQFLRKQLDVVTRAELRQKADTKLYDEYDEEIRTKGESGFRGVKNPVKYKPGDRFVSEIPNAVILGPVGLGLTPTRKPILDTVTHPPISSIPSRRVGISLSQSMSENGIRTTLRTINGSLEPKEKFKEVAVAIPPWNNYYHWSIECLPLFRLLEKHGKGGRFPTVLIPTNPPKWMKESTEMIGYPGEIKEWRGGIATTENLIVPTFPDPIPLELRWLRNRMQSAINSKEKGPSRIYISRDDATIRRVSNRETVESILDDYNFKKLTLSDLNVSQQVSIFSTADVVIAPHGAGLTNIMYSEDISVLEIFDSNPVATFDRIADMLGLEYEYMLCDQKGVDIQIDPEKLRRYLDKLI